MEELGRELDPGFCIASEAARLLDRVLFAHAASGGRLRHGWHTLAGAVDLIAGLRRDLRELLRSARRGRLQMQVEVLSLMRFADQLDRAAGRLALCTITAALIVGSAMVMNIERTPPLPSGPSFGRIGLVAAAIGGSWGVSRALLNFE